MESVATGPSTSGRVLGSRTVGGRERDLVGALQKSLLGTGDGHRPGVGDVEDRRIDAAAHARHATRGSSASSLVRVVSPGARTR